MVKVRRYQAADKDALVQFWQTVFPDDPVHNAPARVIDEKLRVDDLIFVAEQPGGDVAGTPYLVGACMAGYDGHRGWLYAVAVLPDQQRRGIGKQLVLHSIDTLCDLGCVKINLQIRTDNTAVAGFYKSMGFSIEDRVSMGLLV